MRIKIKGEITAERLAEALQVAAEKYEAISPGHKIYGGNLYLTAFDADGLPFDLVDHHGESLLITIEAKSGELVRPGLSAEAKERRQEAKKHEKRQIQKEEANARAWRDWLEQRNMELNHEFQKRQEEIAQEKKLFEDLNAITAQLLQNIPERFLNDLNNTVQSVWHDLKPIEPHGKKKGQPKPLPIFSISMGSLMLTCATWKKGPRHVLNPICTFSDQRITPFWRNDAWKETENRIASLLDHLQNSLVEILNRESYKKRRNKTVRLAEYFDEIMALKAQKYSHKLIVAALRKLDLNFTTPGTFEMTLGRIAKKRKEQGEFSTPDQDKFAKEVTQALAEADDPTTQWVSNEDAKKHFAAKREELRQRI